MNIEETYNKLSKLDFFELKKAYFDFDGYEIKNSFDVLVFVYFIKHFQKIKFSEKNISFFNFKKIITAFDYNIREYNKRFNKSDYHLLLTIDNDNYCEEVVQYVFSDKFDIFNFTDNVFEHKFKFLVCVFYGLDFRCIPCYRFIVDEIESNILNEDNCIDIYKSFVNIFGESSLPVFQRLENFLIKNKNFEPSIVKNNNSNFFKRFNIIYKDKSKLFKTKRLFGLETDIIDYFYFNSDNDEVIDFTVFFDENDVNENPHKYLDRFDENDLFKIYSNVSKNKESILKVMESKGFDREDLIFI